MESNTTNLSKDDPDLQKLCPIAFDALCKELKIPHKETPFPEKLKDAKFPLFVTWTKGPNKDLRGCIGTFRANLLKTSLPEFALISAMEDDRFTPVKAKEVPSLNCGVSLLVNFEKGKNAYDWEVGTHGIEIHFKADGHNFNATFLPEVAEEEKWDKKTTLQELIEKAGYYGDLEDVEDKIELERYQSYKYFMTYQQYLDAQK